MPSANPLDQLRRRLQAATTPVAFASLAEEHRRAGRFADAIDTCRAGLERYPTYVSARVTLGRALLDSGDVLAAVQELELAVSQAPDNIAASRALEAARAARAELPDGGAEEAVAPAEADPLAEFTIERPAVVRDTLASLDDATWIAPVEQSADVDTTNPEPWLDADATTSADVAADAESADSDASWGTHAEERTIQYTSPHPQGDEPAGIWPVPDAAFGDAVFADATSDVEPEGDPAVTHAFQAWTAEEVAANTEPIAHDASSHPNVSDALEDDAALGGTGSWGALLEEPVSDGAAPSAFAGWDEPGPDVPPTPAWVTADAPGADAPVFHMFEAAADDRADDRDSASAPFGADAEVEPALADVSAVTVEARGEAPSEVPTPPSLDLQVDFALQDEDSAEPLGVFAVVETADADPESSATFAETPAPLVAAEALLAEVSEVPAPDVVTGHDDVVEGGPVAESTDVGDAEPIEPGPDDWSRLVASALEEVFAQAAPPDPALAQQMAEVAVDAAREDTARGAEATDEPVVALQQLLAAVRARRAALVDPVD